MGPRTLSISCPGCLTEFRDITVDEAERILFHGCEDCRGEGRTRPDEDPSEDADDEAPTRAANGS